MTTYQQVLRLQQQRMNHTIGSDMYIAITRKIAKLID